MDNEQLNNVNVTVGNENEQNDLTAALSLIAEMKESLDAQTKEIVELKKANMKLALQTSGPTQTSIEDALYDAFLKK